MPNVNMPNALDGFDHTLENFDYTGTIPWETSSQRSGYKPVHYRMSKFGFFTDYPIDNFPRKGAKEFRIILMGGSGAQGHGASSNEAMFYKKLEKKLTADLADTGTLVRVINMALQGHHAFTNVRVLNMFAHGLDADMILAYNGPNDIAQPWSSKFIIGCNYSGWYQSLTYDYPPMLQPFAKLFLRVFAVHGLGPWLKRTFFTDYYNELGEIACLRQFGVIGEDGKRISTEQFYQRVVRHYFTASMQSIKRDFCGIPITIALQAIHLGERRIYEGWYGRGIYKKFGLT